MAIFEGLEGFGLLCKGLKSEHTKGFPYVKRFEFTSIRWLIDHLK